MSDAKKERGKKRNCCLDSLEENSLCAFSLASRTEAAMGLSKNGMSPARDRDGEDRRRDDSEDESINESEEETEQRRRQQQGGGRGQARRRPRVRGMEEGGAEESSDDDDDDGSDEEEEEDSSDMDAGECERRRVEFLDDLQELERQFAVLREQ